MKKRYQYSAVIFLLDESSDIKRLLRRYGYTVRELPACETWQDLLGHE